VVQVHPGPPFKSPINTRLFSLFPFREISLERAIFQKFAKSPSRLTQPAIRVAECSFRNWCERISVNPAVCHSRACVRGTRVLVSAMVDNVAAGVPREEILRDYAALTDPDIDAALAYAAELTREGTVDLPLEIKA